MFQSINKLVNYYTYNYNPPMKHGEEGVKQCGHRGYIGGDYEREGNHQFNYCMDMGLKPSNILADIGCGSLRLGRKIMPYLDEGNYIGIEREQLLIDLAIKQDIKNATTKFSQ